MINDPTISLDHAQSADSSPRVAIKLQWALVELNLRLQYDEIAKLQEIEKASWDERASVRLGECLGRPVFWCSDGDSVTMLVGEDDETWDLAIQLSRECYRALHKLLRDFPAA